MTWKFDEDSKSDIVLCLKWLNGPQKSNFLFMDRFEYFFSLTCKFDVDSKSNIILHLKWLFGPQKSNFLIMDRFEIFFSLTWKFDGDSKSDIVLSLKWLSEQKTSNFLVYVPIWIKKILWLGNLMEIPNLIFNFTSNASLDHKSLQ